MTTGQFPKRRETDEQAAARTARTSELVKEGRRWLLRGYQSPRRKGGTFTDPALRANGDLTGKR